MHPGAHNEGVFGRGALFFESGIETQRTLEVFCVKPAANGEHGGRDVSDVPSKVAGLPEIVVSSVSEEIGPIGAFALEVLFVGIGEGTEALVKVVAIAGAEVEAAGIGIWQFRPGLFLTERSVETEVGGEVKSAIVISVAAEKEIHNRGLGAGCLEGGVGIDHGGGGIETGIRNADDARFAVVAPDVLEQPFDGVVSVGGLVDIPSTTFDRFVRSHLDEFAFAEVAATDILTDENVAAPGEEFVGTEVGPVPVGTIGSATVGRAAEQEWIAAAGILWHVDGSEEKLAVAHRNPMFIFGVIRLDVLCEYLRGHGLGLHKLGLRKY